MTISRATHSPRQYKMFGGDETTRILRRHVTASVATADDQDWIVWVLTRRREPLVKFAPVLWRPPPDAEVHHRGFIECLLTEGRAKAYRTDDSVLIAAPRGDGWPIDDASIQGELWASGDGASCGTP